MGLVTTGVSADTVTFSGARAYPVSFATDGDNLFVQVSSFDLKEGPGGWAIPMAYEPADDAGRVRKLLGFDEGWEQAAFECLLVCDGAWRPFWRDVMSRKRFGLTVVGGQSLYPNKIGEREAVGVRAADEHRPCAERDRLERVGAAVDTAVEEHRDPVADRLDDRRQRVERRDRAVDLAAAVVGDDDAVDPVLDGRPRVVGVEYALEQDGQLRKAAEERQVGPGERRTGVDLEELPHGRARAGRAPRTR